MGSGNRCCSMRGHRFRLVFRSWVPWHPTSRCERGPALLWSSISQQGCKCQDPCSLSPALVGQSPRLSDGMGWRRESRPCGLRYMYTDFSSFRFLMFRKDTFVFRNPSEEVKTVHQKTILPRQLKRPTSPTGCPRCLIELLLVDLARKTCCHHLTISTIKTIEVSVLAP
jgi:hypothetical protein